MKAANKLFAVKLIYTLCLLIVVAVISFSLGMRECSASEDYGPYRATVVRVIDGDSVVLDVHIWPGLTQQINLRLAGINTPELRAKNACEKKEAERVKAFVEGALQPGLVVAITDVELGKFAGRALGRIHVHGHDLGQHMIHRGYAREYDGGARDAWCAD